MSNTSTATATVMLTVDQWLDALGGDKDNAWPNIVAELQARWDGDTLDLAMAMAAVLVRKA